MTEIISTTNLSKHYGELKAVDSISLSISKGEVYGFLGLNGAGKTTTIRMLLGMISPTSGTVYLKGKRVNSGSPEIWNDVGYLVEVPYSYPELTVKENLEIIRKLRGITAKNIVKNIISKLKLDAYINVKAKHLSLGNNQRLGLAKALMHNPSILIFDEPANGLDPAGIVEVRDLLHQLAQDQGVTIFISSHILGEISKMASRIGIIHQGRLIQEVDTEQLKFLQQKKLAVNTRNNKLACSTLIDAKYNCYINENHNIVLEDLAAVTRPEEVAGILVSSGCPPTHLSIEEEDLEAYFLRTIGETGGSI